MYSLPKHKVSGEVKGFAFIEFDKKDSVVSAESVSQVITSNSYALIEIT